MIRYGWILPALAAFAFFPLTVPVSADETGLASIHTQRKEGRRVCFVDHFHYGSSSGQASKKAAMAAAVRSWIQFTDFEYGSRWASWKRASGKTASCTGASGSWGCDLSARPCR